MKQTEDAAIKITKLGFLSSSLPQTAPRVPMNIEIAKIKYIAFPSSVMEDRLRTSFVLPLLPVEIRVGVDDTAPSPKRHATVDFGHSVCTHEILCFPSQMLSHTYAPLSGASYS